MRAKTRLLLCFTAAIAAAAIALTAAQSHGPRTQRVVVAEALPPAPVTSTSSTVALATTTTAAPTTTAPTTTTTLRVVVVPTTRAPLQAVARRQPETYVSHTSSGGFEACVEFRESTDGRGSPNLYGILPSTWASLGLPGSPYTASPTQQQQAFQELYARDGVSPWAPYDGC